MRYMATEVLVNIASGYRVAHILRFFLIMFSLLHVLLKYWPIIGDILSFSMMAKKKQEYHHKTQRLFVLFC